jgi:NAD(P)H-dependent FMN reductase
MDIGRHVGAYLDAPNLVRPMIVGLAGSSRQGSSTRKACETALHAAAGVGCSVQLLDLAEIELPICREVTEPAATVVEFRRRLTDAHGLVLACPEYHGAYTGVLKNAVDWLHPNALLGKVVGVIGLGGGAAGGLRAMDALVALARTLGAWHIAQGVWVPGPAMRQTELGLQFAGEFTARLSALGEYLATAAARLCEPVVRPTNVVAPI